MPSNLKLAVTEWAGDTDHLLLYLVGHGEKNLFEISKGENLADIDLDSWLDAVQELISGEVAFVYDACHSGSFLPDLTPPADKKRILVASACEDQEASFGHHGSLSFSNYFWNKIFHGESIGDAFRQSSNAIRDITAYEGGAKSAQTPLLDANGNVICGKEDEEDYDSTRDAYIGNSVFIPGEAPVIEQVGALPDTSENNVYVRAIIRPIGSEDVPEETVDLAFSGEGRYEGTYDQFDGEGTYHIAVYAEDRKGNMSSPQMTTVSVGNPMRNKAIIVAGHLQTGELPLKGMQSWPMTR